ncbi:MAG: hypothetical protein M1305_07540, partial [Candidatus Marsarchaeota archaeon]|nr:hypothetical protein [Candidatus Marsarchaeota archaeon]
MSYHSRRGMPLPRILHRESTDGKGLEFAVCPGKGCDIIRLSEAIKGEPAQYDLWLGFVYAAWATQSTESRILGNASSGGAMTSIAAYLLASGRVRGVVATGLTYG